jgi:hypothetical protein
LTEKRSPEGQCRSHTRCIDSAATGPYYAFLVHGVKDHPFAFVGKCCWTFGQNKMAEVIGPGVVLKSTTGQSTDGSGTLSGGKKHKGSGDTW